MKHYAAILPSRPRHIRVPAFLPVPLRSRADGWTPLRQAVFLVALAASCSVSAAARKAEMSRESAYRLRLRAGAESFAAVWDAVLGGAGVAGVRGKRRKVTPEERMRRALDTLIKPVVWRGECTALVKKNDDSALLGFLAQLDRTAVPE